MSKDKLGKRELGPDDDVVQPSGDSHRRSNTTSRAKMPDKATLTRMGDSESLGITLPKKELEKLGIEAGDEVVLLPSDDDPNTFTLYFPPEE